ncbi:hypothetical protein [Sphingopyxis alaskensis]|uniref:hypothetical protein n=1 Tax=Sphingopyxis alaskensis TaxID=117207 RepID=UPI00391D5767
MAQEVNIETIEFAPFIQIINGEEYRSYEIFAKIKDEEGNDIPSRVKIGEIGPDTNSQVSWINDRSVTIYDAFDSTTVSDYVEDQLDRLRFDLGGGGFQTPPNVGDG